jgi:GxxExxY protein
VGHEFEDLSTKVIAAALAVHRQLGPGFLEPVYQAAMKVSLSHRSLAFQSQVPVDICFEGVKVGHSRLDLVIASQLILELKAVDAIQQIHFAQLRSYLRATGLRVGLLFNCNAPTLAIRRMVLD